MTATTQSLAPAVPRTYAELIDRDVNAALDEFSRSELGHNEATDELLDLWEEYSEAGWDGFGALAVEPGTFAMAYRLIRSLPVGFPRPSIGAEPDGQLTLEWYKSPSRILSVSVAPEGVLHFAGLFGGNNEYGTLEFFGTAPDKLKRLVEDL